MSILEEQASAPARFDTAEIIAGPPRSNDLFIRHAVETDALDVKSVMDSRAPHSRYASYYYAMNFLFVPNTSLVARDANHRAVGAFVGLYDFTFRKLVVSHIAASLALGAERARDVEIRMLRQAFADAAQSGVGEIDARLDFPLDPLVEQAAHRLAAQHGLHASFNYAGDQSHILPVLVPDDLDKTAIAYRHPNAGDAVQLWSLVLHVNKNSGGLDLYALSNYQRLCRDFSESCMVAEIDGHIIGFASGFMMPDENGRKGLFLWQTGVHPAYHGLGIGSKVETLLIDEHRPDYLNFTVEASNKAANRTAEKKAEYMGLGYTKPGAISSETLGFGHEAEIIYKIG